MRCVVFSWFWGGGTGGTFLSKPSEDLEDILGTQPLGNITERVDGGTTDTLLVRLQEVEKLEADTHPLARGHELGAAVGDAADQVDGCFLDLFVSVAQDGGHARYCGL